MANKFSCYGRCVRNDANYEHKLTIGKIYKLYDKYIGVGGLTYVNFISDTSFEDGCLLERFELINPLTSQLYLAKERLENEK